METSKVESSQQVSRAKRAKVEAERRAAAQLERERETQIRVLDRGEDRTPLPLLKQADPSSKGIVRRGADKKGTSESASQQESSQMESSQASEGGSASTPDEDSTTGLGESDGSYSLERSSISHSVDVRGRSEVSVTSKGTGDRSSKENAASAPQREPEREKPREWTAEQKREWLGQEVTVILRETPVVMLFSHQDEVVCSENTEEVRDVLAANERYNNQCELMRKDEGTKFQCRGITTLSNPKKSIHSEIHPPGTKNSGGLHVTPWKLYDEYVKLAEEELEAEDPTAKHGDGDGDGMQENPAGDEGEANDGGDGEDGDDNSASSAKKSSAWLFSDSLLANLLIMERVVVQNIVEDLQLAYRGLHMDPLKDHLPEKKSIAQSPVKKRTDAFGYRGEQDDDDDDQASTGGNNAAQKARSETVPSNSRQKLKVMWRYGNELTAGKNVSCIAWNRRNPDILAAGYGEYGIPHAGKKYSGLVCCWSLKNPLAPERVIQLESEAGVSAVSFSSLHPSLLAVGNTDGTLALYDVRKHGNAPALKTTVSTGQHTGTIWEVKWVERGKGRGENLVSISADGRVLEWSIKKGLERNAPDLMKLKRMPTKNHDGPAGGDAARGGKGAAAGKEALLSRQSGGMCFDMNPRELITYVVGTEDGTIHKCSKSQSENYVLDYKPHEEPVYRIRWSPFCPQYFLTCSADWTSRLYHIDKTDPVLTLDSNKQDAVHDVCWSHTNATIFAAATAHGHVDVWDIADPLQPRASLELENRSLNCLLFAEQESPVLAVGDNYGDITVVKLSGLEFERGGLSNQDQEDRFLEVVKRVSS